MTFQNEHMILPRYRLTISSRVSYKYHVAHDTRIIIKRFAWVLFHAFVKRANNMLKAFSKSFITNSLYHTLLSCITSNHIQWHRNVFEDTWDKKTSVLNLVGTIFKNRTFSRLCPKIQLLNFAYIRLLKKPYENEVTLTE